MFESRFERRFQAARAQEVRATFRGPATGMQLILWTAALGWTLFAGTALAYDCSALPEWKRQHYYLPGEEVQYQGIAYWNESDSGSKRDRPDDGYPWDSNGACDGPGSGGEEPPPSPDPQAVSVYGAWHCGNDYCTWSSVRDMDEFDQKNHWLIDRGVGGCNYRTSMSCSPSVNLVILSFVHPLKLLHGTDEGILNGVPKGMTQGIVDYFKNQGIRVMLSIGGITYTDAWNQALADDPVQLGLNAAAVAQSLGVGIEIDYEENRNPNLDGLEAFILAYRDELPYVAAPNSDGSQDANRLTIDLAAGDRWLVALTERATRDWLNNDYSQPALDVKLDYANAMVTARQPSADSAIANWQEHVDGKPQYDPPIPPLAPAKFTGSLWLTGRKPAPECVDFDQSLQKATSDFVQTVLPSPSHPDYTLLSNGMLGFMFWAAECEGTRTACTTQDDHNSCEGGMGAAASVFNIPIPMQPLRQQ